VKQAIIVPTWLKMSPGKVASQCCHAALWGGGQPDDIRVVLKIESQAHVDTLTKLVELMADAGAYITIEHFTDSGPTTEGTEGVTTAYWIRGEEPDVNFLTGHLELY
jgi:hypothetical protein